MGRVGSAGRAVGRFLSDWKNGATLLASVLVALLVVSVADGMQARGDALDQAKQNAATATATAAQAKSAQQAATRRIDMLSKGQQQLVREVALLAAENAALRQQVADMGGSPTQVSPTSSGAARAFPAPTPAPHPSPTHSASPSPRPSPKPSPSPSPSCRRLPIIGCPGAGQ